jgi:hypothetical protein
LSKAKKHVHHAPGVIDALRDEGELTSSRTVTISNAALHVFGIEQKIQVNCISSSEIYPNSAYANAAFSKLIFNIITC